MKYNIDIRGSLIHAEWHNENPDRPTIIFLHDSFGCITLWRSFPAKLANNMQMNYLIYDRHGYGKSGPFIQAQRPKNYLHLEAEILSELIQKLNIQNIILFGHSDGASIALLTAALFPEKIKAIITEGAHIFVEDITQQGIINVVNNYHSSGLHQRLQKYHGNHTDALFYAWHHTWLADSYRDWNIINELKNITCPALIIQGSEDEFGTEAQMDGIIHNVKSTAIKALMPQTGHNPHKENPEETIKICIDFLIKYG